VRAAIPAQECTDDYDKPKQDRLNCLRQDQNRLGSTMAQGDVRQVEQGRPVRWPRVQDFKHRLEVTVQIDRWSREAIKGEGVIAIIPPPVRDTVRQPHGVASLHRQPLTIDLRRQGARSDYTLLIFKMMNVQRRPLPVRRKRSPKPEHWLPIARLTPDFKNFTGVLVGESQRCLTGQHCCRFHSYA
jgi:hypothetical protein